jgi:hypothetical protein
VLREISIASHFMSKGWDVEFVDYSGAARFDLLALRRMIEIEVECKSTSGDTGRKIHRQGSSSPCRLAAANDREACRYRGLSSDSRHDPGSSGKSSEDLSTIASVLESAAQQKGAASNSLAHVEYTYDDIAPAEARP